VNTVDTTIGTRLLPVSNVPRPRRTKAMVLRVAAVLTTVVGMLLGGLAASGPAAAFTCTTATYNGTAYCLGTIPDLNVNV
jgi:hypothetical protein